MTVEVHTANKSDKTIYNQPIGITKRFFEIKNSIVEISKFYWLMFIELNGIQKCSSLKT